MQTWQAFINEKILNQGGDPEKIVASDFLPADLEDMYDSAFVTHDTKSVWTDTHVYTFLWDCEGYDYTCVSAQRNPTKIQPADPDEDVVVHVGVYENHCFTYKFAIARRRAEENQSAFEERCRNAARDLSESAADFINTEFVDFLDKDNWTVEVQA